MTLSRGSTVGRYEIVKQKRPEGARDAPQKYVEIPTIGSYGRAQAKVWLEELAGKAQKA